jgi:hypothetical protein
LSNSSSDGENLAFEFTFMIFDFKMKWLFKIKNFQINR